MAWRYPRFSSIGGGSYNGFRNPLTHNIGGQMGHGLESMFVRGAYTAVNTMGASILAAATQRVTQEVVSGAAEMFDVPVSASFASRGAGAGGLPASYRGGARAYPGRGGQQQGGHLAGGQMVSDIGQLVQDVAAAEKGDAGARQRVDAWKQSHQGMQQLPRGSVPTGMLGEDGTPLNVRLNGEQLNGDNVVEFLSRQVRQGLGRGAPPRAAAAATPAAAAATPGQIIFENVSGRGTQEVANAQIALESLGFKTDAGGVADRKVDGVEGGLTRAAVAKAEELLVKAGKLDANHRVDGRVDDDFTRALQAAQSDPTLSAALKAVSGGHEVDTAIRQAGGTIVNPTVQRGA